jgi:hypothetical protein
MTLPQGRERICLLEGYHVYDVMRMRRAKSERVTLLLIMCRLIRVRAKSVIDARETLADRLHLTDDIN